MLFVCRDLHQIAPEPSRAEPATLGWKPLDHFTDNNLGNLFFFLKPCKLQQIAPVSRAPTGKVEFPSCFVTQPSTPTSALRVKKKKKTASTLQVILTSLQTLRNFILRQKEGPEIKKKKRTSRTFARADGVLCASEIGNKWLTKSRETDTAALCQHTPGD